MSETATLRVQDEPALWRVRLADLRGRGVYAGYPNVHRCIFIHIPKAAGSSIARSLFGSISRHLTYRVYLRANPRKFRRFFKFTFVRNPWDRVVSTFFFLKSGGINELDRNWATANLSGIESFEQFIREGLNRPKILSGVHFRPQAEFICSDDDRVMVDFVGRFESLERDFACVVRALGVDAVLTFENKSDHPPYTACYTRETAAIVGRIYARDARIFGYSAPI